MFRLLSMKPNYYRDKYFWAPTPLLVGGGMRLEFRPLELGGNDLHHFWAWLIKSSTGSSALCLPYLLTRFEQFQIPRWRQQSFYQFKSLMESLEQNVVLLPIQTHSTTNINLHYVKPLRFQSLIYVKRHFLFSDKYKQKTTLFVMKGFYNMKQF